MSKINGSEDRSSNAVTVWMPLAAIAAAITFVIAFIMQIPQEQTIATSALAAILVFSTLLFSHLAKTRPST